MRRIKTIAVILLAAALCSCSNESADTHSELSVQAYTENITSPITDGVPDILPPKEGMGKLVSLCMNKEDNPSLTQSLFFEIDEQNKSAKLTLDHKSYADISTMKRAKLAGEALDGEISFPDGEYADLTRETVCRVTDADGGVRDYVLTVDRDAFKLPIVSITLADGVDVLGIDREQTTEMTLSLDCTAVEDAESLIDVSGKIRGRGNSTWKWDKKPYKIKLDEKASVLGLASNRDWILLSNYADKSLIRNTLAYEMGRVLDRIAWSPHQYPVDLFVNGEYRGVYSIGEHMEVASGRVDIEENSSQDDTDYLIEIGGADETGMQEGVHYFHTDGMLVRYATFKSPDEDAISDGQRRFIEDFFNRAEDAIIAGEGYEEYIDVDSFIDWILLHELTNNLDSCFRRSCYLVKDKGGKLRMGPIWDFDLAFGNFSKDNKDYDTWITVGGADEKSYVWENWCTYLMRDSDFCRKLADRWNEVRIPLLECADATVTVYSGLLDVSQQANFDVWQIWDVRAGYQSSWCMKENTYEKQIQYLRDFLQKRSAWMDTAITKLPK